MQTSDTEYIETTEAPSLPQGFDTGTQSLPPMLQEYIEYKRKHSDCVILFQVGDFYEIFFEDAQKVAKTINLTLTSRDKTSLNPIPMCGVPVGAIEHYAARMLDAGFSVALISQLNSPSADGTKGVAVQRGLSRILTPGVRLLSLQNDSPPEFVAAALPWTNGDYGIAFCSPETGMLSTCEAIDRDRLIEELRLIQPRELILPLQLEGKKFDRRTHLVRLIEKSLPRTILKFRSLDSSRSSGISRNAELSALTPCCKRAAEQLLSFLDETTAGSRFPISHIAPKTVEGVLQIDPAARQSLELVTNQRDGGRGGTLYQLLDICCSPGGSRALKSWILEPLCDVARIQKRQSVVQYFFEQDQYCTALREKLSLLADLERIASRLELKAASPRELGAVRDAVTVWSEIQKQFDEMEELPEGLRILREMHREAPELLRFLGEALVDNPPALLSEAPTIRPGFSPELDRVRELKEGAGGWMQAFEADERLRTGIQSLKVRSNNVLGFFIEVTKPNLPRIPAEYIRRQSTAQSERFTTPELRIKERDFSQALNLEEKLERELVEELKLKALEHVSLLREIGRALAELDVLLSLGQMARAEGWVKPRVGEFPECKIVEGRHPVISKLLAGQFVANTIDLGDPYRRCLIITGPNMGGKSTYLRQTALLVIMAQLGSFVAAKEADIGIVDRIFARIGASDNLLEGESTFMVEMRETAQILAHATRRSLVLIDELGRGTATADGYALARAIIEWLCERAGCRVLFATHFHELTQLSSRYPQIQNLSVSSVEMNGDVVFTHSIVEGPANRSYGLEVAKLAGISPLIISRAREIVQAAEGQNSLKMMSAHVSEQLSLFPASSPVEEAGPSESEMKLALLQRLVQRVRELSLDTLSARDALNFLYEFQPLLPEE